ncbi:F-box DNA helicase 1-like isoform X3 [Clavelina lepadiformis]|uniref:F-box DNA helicase 1-like isoform X3 n=1 Tax=Clavelina lepadiformis TaxID=159417 RepID=UPI0040414EF4
MILEMEKFLFSPSQKRRREEGHSQSTPIKAEKNSASPPFKRCLLFGRADSSNMELKNADMESTNHTGKSKLSTDILNESGDLFPDDDFDNILSSLPDEVMSGSQPLPGETASSQSASSDKIIEADQLPDHVLESIFSCLPAVDFCQSCSVCKRWNSIISHDQFMPWKKSYNLIRIKQDDDELCNKLSMLQSADGPDEVTMPVVTLVRTMSRWRPITLREDERVQLAGLLIKHRLHDLAHEMTEKRISGNSSTMNDDYLWMVASSIVLLSPDVSSIVVLQKLLLKVFQLPLVLDFFYSLATYAWVLYKEDYLSQTHHYRIFCSISNVENSSKPLPLERTEEKSLCTSKKSLTHEQRRVINHKFEKGQKVRVMAYAGTGKTTTLAECVRTHPDLHFLYTSFNKAVVDQGRNVFRAANNVKCYTMHSMAYRAMRMQEHRHKLGRGSLRARHIREKLGLESDTRTANLVKRTFLKFVASSASGIKLQHVPAFERVHDDALGMKSEPVEEDRRRWVLDLTKLFWRKTSDLSNKEWTMIDDCYLKQWQLSEPEILGYDVILLDEAQDCTECMRDLLIRQLPHAALVFVGDTHQQIYGFRRAYDALLAIPPTHSYYLTQSFRFGQEIAQVADCILRELKFNNQAGNTAGVSEKTLLGVGNPGSVHGVEVGSQKAILCRKNVGVIQTLWKLLSENEDGKKIALVGGSEKLGLGLVMDLYALSLPQKERREQGLTIRSRFVRQFPSLKALAKDADECDDTEMLTKLEIVRVLGDQLPQVVAALKGLPLSIEGADIVVSTVHKAKGLEFDTVVIAEDLGKCFKNASQGAPGQVNFFHKEEANLLYVAATRARKSLVMSPTLCSVLRRSKIRFFEPGFKSSDDTICSVCKKMIETNSRIIFKLPAIPYMQDGGVICPNCGVEVAPGWGHVLGDSD